MICWRCKAKIPDGAESCPICSAIQKRKIGFRTHLQRWMLRTCPLICIIMNGINAYLLATGAHYVTDMRYGLWVARTAMYTYFPVLYIADMILVTFLLAIFVMAIRSAFLIQQGRESAPVMMMITNICAFLWSLFYLTSSLYFTGIISPVLSFTVAQMAIFALWTVGSSIYLFKCDYFLF